MDIPNILKRLLKAQQESDSVAYADCFSETAIVYDEGQVHRGKSEIRTWNRNTNAKYKTVLEPLDITAEDDVYVLTSRVSGTFEGSPVVLKFRFGIREEQIRSLEITP